MASNNSSEYKVVADKIVSPDEDIVFRIEGALYLNSIEEPNRIATVADLGVGQNANTGDFTFEGPTATAPGDISITSNTAPGTITLSAYAGVEVATHADFGLTTRKIITTNNGSTDNIAVGDDAYIGDGNVANHVVIVGQQDSLEGGSVLGERLGEKIYTDGENLTIEAAGAMRVEAVGGDMNFYMDGGMYIGPSDSGNQIIKRSDLNALPQEYFQSVRWTPSFTATGLTFTGTDTTHPTYQSHYVKQGQLVSFWIAVDCATVTSFGTGQLNLELPFAPLPGTMNHFSGWVQVDETANPDLAGHIIVNADHLPNTQTLDLHYIKSAGGANSPVMEAMLMQNTPAVLTTLTNIYVNGTYIAAE